MKETRRIENVPNLIFTVDSSGLIKTWSSACAATFGYGPEMIGTPLTGLLWSIEDEESLISRIAEVFNHKSFDHVDVSFRSSTSEQLFFVTRLYPQGDPEGEVKSCVFNNTDVTELIKTESRMKHRLNIERLVSTISSRFVGVYRIDRAIDATLRDLGRFSKADRAYLFQFRENGAVMSNTHEWCRENVSPQKKNLQELFSSEFPWWVERIFSGEPLHIRDVAQLTEEATIEREILTGHDVKSVLVIGFTIEGKTAGFIGLDNVTGDAEWDEGDLALLRTVSEIVGNALERNLAEELVRNSVDEKELLLREVHHRVKNNLQVVSSLLDLSMLYTENDQARHILEDARSKVNTMALIHTHLYREEKIDRINLAQCLSTLVEQLSCIYSSSCKIDTFIQSSELLLSINQAIPCALVLNELISNAFKHAFRERQTGILEIFIDDDRADVVSILLRDNGAGIPEDIDLETATSLGLTLVKNLVRNQLRGEVCMRRKGGTEFTIRFRASDTKAFGSS
jgi:two-component sensor histidine kinase